MSARMPVTTAMGALAKVPDRNLKISKTGQLGARAQAIVKSTNRTNVPMVMSRRPNCSLKGAQTIGPLPSKLSVYGGASRWQKISSSPNT